LGAEVACRGGWGRIAFGLVPWRMHHNNVDRLSGNSHVDADSQPGAAAKAESSHGKRDGPEKRAANTREGSPLAAAAAAARRAGLRAGCHNPISRMTSLVEADAARVALRHTRAWLSTGSWRGPLNGASG